MLKNLGGWIHSFTVTETKTHKKGYTVYKITSIVFPRAVPEALTCISVWKRFSEIKRLYRELAKRHKSSLQLRGKIPEPRDIGGFFRRFDPTIIQERKDYILRLLDFAGQHPSLYKSHAFLNFFEQGHTPPNTSPLHQTVPAEKLTAGSCSNIESICGNLNIPFNENDLPLVDPVKGKKDYGVTENAPLDKQYTIEELPLSLQEDYHITAKKTTNDAFAEDDCASVVSTPSILLFEIDNTDYIYEAAYDFSRGVQAEVNQSYKEAFDNYRSGVDKLLTGSKDDPSEERKSIAKRKVAKYMSKAEKIYEKHILEGDLNDMKRQLSIDETDTLASETNEYLERPLNQLSKFKVLKIVDSVMQVQDVTDKRIYIMKAIEKPSSNLSAQTIFLVQNIPYMVRLHGFFQSETAVYLLLQQAKGGKLFEYIQTYSPERRQEKLPKNCNEIFTEPKSGSKIQENCNINEVKVEELDTSIVLTNTKEDSFMEMVRSYSASSSNDNQEIEIEQLSGKNDSENQINSTESQILTELEANEQNYVPSFDVLSEDMEVKDLLKCSKKLLRSVTNTIEQSRELDILTAESQDQKIKRKTKETKKRSEIINKIDENKTENTPKYEIMINIPADHQLSNRISLLPEPIISRWAKELIVSIETLHSKDVILGDLHPDNILLGSNGQLLLTYFYKNVRTNDSVTQLLLNPLAVERMYVAPERPLTYRSDWWSFGVILYELFTGRTFRSCHPGNLASYYALQYPEEETLSESVKELLEGVLEYNAELRFDSEKIRNHKFFSNTNWTDVVKVGLE